MSDDDGALFGIPELAVDDVAALGRAEAALQAAVRAASAEGRIVDLDAAAVGAALVAARGLDAAENRVRALKGGGIARGPDPYAIAALLTPYRELLHALRLPAAVEPEGVPLPGEGQSTMPEWMHDAFGSAE